MTAKIFKDAVHKIFLKNSTAENRQAYARSRNDIDALISRKKFYLRPIEKKRISECPKSGNTIWTMVKQIQNTALSAITTFVHNDVPITKCTAKAELLAAYFAESSLLPPTNFNPF